MLKKFNYPTVLIALILSSAAIAEDDLSFPKTKAQWIKALALDAPAHTNSNVNSNARFHDKSMGGKGLCLRAKVIVQFNSNLSVVLNNSELNELGAALSEYPNDVVKVEGHTDNKGSDKYNLKLSERRAVAVRDYLIKNYGIDEQRLPVVGYGESYPLYPKNANKKERALNRRVEFCKL